MFCCRCGCEDRIRSGFVHGFQRFKCKGCGYHYREAPLKRRPAQDRVMALKLYTEGVGFRGIGRLLEISHTTAQRWIKKGAVKAKEATLMSDAPVLELDELCSYLKKRPKNSGSGSRPVR
jgi:transposase